MSIRSTVIDRESFKRAMKFVHGGTKRNRRLMAENIYRKYREDIAVSELQQQKMSRLRRHSMELAGVGIRDIQVALIKDGLIVDCRVGAKRIAKEARITCGLCGFTAKNRTEKNRHRRLHKKA